jgi:zinc D-Ala-D-Ala carboxypeptidase
MRISKNITLQEATFSPTAFRLGIKNEPNEEQLANMKLVAEKCFQPLREWYKKPIRINSFFRCKELNTAVKGSKTSDHMEGKAIDISAGNKHANKVLFDWLKNNVEYDQLLWEYGDALGPQWVHISYNKEKNRKQILYIK